MAKTPQIPEKRFYDVRVETMLPAVLTYRVLAENAEQAASLIANQSPIGVKHKLIGKRDIVLKVYESGSLMIKFMKKLFR